MTSDSASADDGEHTSRTASQGPNSDLNLLDNNFENIFVMQVAMLDGALLSLKKTTDHILSEVRGQPTAIGLAVKNPQTGKRIRLDHARFIRLNKWLGSNIDILRQFIWKDEDNSELRGGGELGENEMPGDLNRILSLLCDKGYSEVIKNTESSLAKTAPLGNTAPKELEVIKYLDFIKEEQNRFKLWTSTTGIDEGALSILVKHDLYKQYGEILQSILVDLISLYEDCFIDDESIIRNLIIPVRNQWLGEARKLLVLLPDKSDKTEHYLLSDAVPKSPRQGPLISIGNQNERNSLDLPSGTSRRGQNPTGNALRQPHSAPPGQDHGPSTPPQHFDGRSPLQLHKSPEPIGSPTRPGSRGSTASTSFSILVDERPLPEYLIDNLKESNKTLIALVRSLEMAKANMGEGSHSEVYQAIRDIKEHNQPQSSSPVVPFQLPPPVEPFQLPLFGEPYISRPPPPEFVKADSHPGTGHSERLEIPLPSSTQPRDSVPVPPAPWSSPRETRVPAPPLEKGQQEKTGPPEKAPQKQSMPQKPSPKIAGQNTQIKLGGAKARDELNYPEIYLWGRIKSAALTEDKDLQYLLGQLQDIGFGLYCSRHSLLLSNLGLPKWVALEVLRCMWNDDSQMTRNSFAAKAKNILSGKEAEPQSVGNNLIGPATPAPPLENYNQQFAIDGKFHGKLYPQALGADTYQSPEDRDWRSSSAQQLWHDRDHGLTHRPRQNDRGQQLISSTAYNSRYEPNYDDSDPYRYSSRSEAPTRAGTFEIPRPTSTSRGHHNPGSPLRGGSLIAMSPRLHSRQNHMRPYNYDMNPVTYYTGVGGSYDPQTYVPPLPIPPPAPWLPPAQPGSRNLAYTPGPPGPPGPTFPVPRTESRQMRENAVEINNTRDSGYHEPSTRVNFNLHRQDSNSMNNPFSVPHRQEHPHNTVGEAKGTKQNIPLSALGRQKSRPRNPEVATTVNPVLEGLKEGTEANDTRWETGPVDFITQ